VFKLKYVTVCEIENDLLVKVGFDKVKSSEEPEVQVYLPLAYQAKLGLAVLPFSPAQTP
jgi:hypothetical protein